MANRCAVGRQGDAGGGEGEMTISKEWLLAPKEKNPDFEGSIWQKMGHDNALCPTCKAHLRSGICLNACHLAPSALAKFQKLAAAVARHTEEK